MEPDTIYRRYRQLQDYVGWEAIDAERIVKAAPLLIPAFAHLIDDFYREIQQHPQTRRVLAGDEGQIQRLKQTLNRWLHELLSGPHDAAYVARRWRVGWRHVEIGLDQVYANVAFSRLRLGLMQHLQKAWAGSQAELLTTLLALNKLLDLDLAIIEDAYQTEHVARQRALEHLEARKQTEAVFRTLVEAAPSLIVILRADAEIVYFNEFAEQLTGYQATEVLGRNYLTMFLPESHHQGVAEQIRNVLAGNPTRGYENPVACYRGTTWHWVVWNAQLLTDFEGSPAVLAIGQDIHPLKEAQEKALQSVRLAAIGQMMTGLAHESGNALARSQACLEMLTLEVEDRPEAMDLIQRIQKAQDHLRLLYEEVRGYAAPLRLEREEVDLSTIWRQAWTNLGVQHQGRDTGLTEELGEVRLSVPVDVFRLEQVFRNIFENSLAACRDPVRVLVRSKEAQIDGQPALGVVIHDNGPGLSAEQCQRIFEPFFTTKTKGTGLGMAIAKRIIDAHGGRILVGNGSSPGAEIEILLPRVVP